MLRPRTQNPELGCRRVLGAWEAPAVWRVRKVSRPATYAALAGRGGASPAKGQTWTETKRSTTSWPGSTSGRVSN